MSSFNLNDINSIKDLDRGDMLGAIERLPKQCEDAAMSASKVTLPLPDKVSAIAVLGMGGSGISGDITRALLEPEIKVPIEVVKGYQLPAHINSDSLVFAVSYSGNTEETLSVFEQAIKRNASIIAITSGGEIKKRALDEGIAVIEIPAGYQPRAALGYLFLPILISLTKVGLVRDYTSDIDETVAILKAQSTSMAGDVQVGRNDAKRLALELYGKVPVIYGTEGISAPAALRWKTQINENAKNIAFANVFSELDHNEIMGWQLPYEATSAFEVVVLRHIGEHEQIKKRVEITLDLIKDNIFGVSEVWAEGESVLANLLSLIYAGDFVSVYLALLNKVDPSPVERIQALKERLQEG